MGPLLYAYRTPIHRLRFGANLIASRDVSDPQILFIETAFGLVLWFQYRPLFRRWYQLVEIDSPWLYACQERFGTQVAIAAYCVRWAISWVLVGVIQAILIVIVMALDLVAGDFFSGCSRDENERLSNLKNVHRENYSAKHLSDMG